MRLEEATEVLGRTPQVVRALLGGLSDPWLTADEGPGTFSPRDVLGHLISGEETDWMPRLRIVLAHGPARAFDAFDRFAHRRTQAGRGVPELLDVFEELRRRNLAELAELKLRPEQLELPGRHPELGGVTLGQLLSTWVVHDLNHVGQIVRVMAGRYAAEVGPWKAYLGILQKK
jgi:uncharacterized damage-inducible protein DinB